MFKAICIALFVQTVIGPGASIIPRFKQFLTSVSIRVCLTVIYVYSLCYVHVIYLTRLQCFPQGDIGLPGPPGMLGPPVSIFFFF